MKQLLMNCNIQKLRIFAILFLLTLSACSREANKEIEAPQITGLSVSVLGTESEQIDMDTKDPKASNERLSPTGKQLAIQSAGDLDLSMTVEKDNFSTNGKTRLYSRQQRGTSSKLLRAESMAPGIVFRMLIYNMDGTLHKNVEATANSELKIDVVKGASYRWIAYSYNRDNSVTLPDVADPLAPILSTGEGYDLLYATDTIDISNTGNTPLGILFKHKLSRVAVELNTMGMFADLNAAQITFAGNYFGKGSIDLFTGVVTNDQNYATTPISSNFQRIPNYSYGDRNVAYFYTSNPGAINSFQVILNNLSIHIDNSTIRTFNSPVSLPAVNLVSSALGKSRTVKIDLIESALTVGSVKWARQNIYYQAGHNPYRFNHTYAHSNNRNSYFAFKAHLPEDWAVRDAEIDPCSLVYPQGVWRNATEDDYDDLLTHTGSRGNVGGLNYIEYAATGTASPYPSNNLRFNYNGQGIAASLAEIISLDLGTTYGNSANLWTTDEILAVPPLISAGSRYYRSTTALNLMATELLNISLLGSINVLQTPFKNVRCVRTAGN